MLLFEREAPILWSLSCLIWPWVPTLHLGLTGTLPHDLAGVWLTDGGRETGWQLTQSRAVPSYQLSTQPGMDQHPGNG